jgi:glycosyltransferase involved in cell wall biosynthesis
MNQNPEVSIGVSFKNPGAPFELAIKSIFAQTFRDWELILMDDDSTDGSREFVEGLADERIRLYHDGLSKPLSVRLNEAVGLSRGKYFLRMDADDIMHPERLDHQVRILQEQDADTVVGSAVYSIDRESKVHGIRGYPGPRAVRFAARHALLHPTIGARTSWFAKHLYDPKFARAEDAELYCRTAPVTTFIVVPEAWVYYREVGLFNLYKHLETHAAVLQILRKYYAKPRAGYVARVSLELVKTWLYMVTDAFGRTDLLYNHRLLPGELKRAVEGLDAVLRQPLPLRVRGERGFASHIRHQER